MQLIALVRKIPRAATATQDQKQRGAFHMRGVEPIHRLGAEVGEDQGSSAQIAVALPAPCSVDASLEAV